MEMDKGLIDKLLGDYQKAEDLIGENGSLKQLTKALVERALQVELTTHLGYEKHSTEGHNSGSKSPRRPTESAPSLPVTVLTDGDAGLRAIHRQVAPQADHVLDWFHISMRFTNLQQLAKGINAVAMAGARSHALAEIDRAKWRLWNALAKRGIVGLVHLGQWVRAPCFEHISSSKKLAHTLLETIRHLELNADSMPDYGKRYRAGQRISTGFAESAVDEIVAKRMVKKQQIRWNQYPSRGFSTFAFMCSMALWKAHSVIGIKASGLSLTKPNRFCQHDPAHNFAHSQSPPNPQSTC